MDSRAIKRYESRWNETATPACGGRKRPYGGAERVMAESDGPREILRRLATVAWLAILLGFAMQALVLAARTSLVGLPALTQILVDLAQGVTWSFFVCAGVGLGTTIARVRASIGGLIGAISAPLAMGLAKGGQKVMASAVGATTEPALFSLVTLGALRALEYGVLGWLLASLAARQETRASRYLAGGAAIGLVFGGAITAWMAWKASSAGAPFTTPRLVGVSLNEILFPIGCSLVVYIALQVGTQVKHVMSAVKAG